MTAPLPKSAPDPQAAPIVRRLTVPLDPARAFRLFTQEMSDWWPLDRHSAPSPRGAPARSVTVPPLKGAQVYETRPDGSTAPWGRVTEYEPGRRFGMTWHPGHPEDRAGQVDVTFDAVADGTRVTLVHSGWQSLETGPTAAAASRHAALCTRFATHARRLCVTA